MKKTIINLGITAGAVYILYRLFKQDDVIPMNKPLPQDLPVPAPEDNFSNFTGIFKKKKKTNSTSRQVATRCATNLERLASLYPNNDQYNAELGKAFQREGSNFNNWAKSEAKPCFVVGGVEQGGLQSGGINFDASDFNFTGAGDFN